MSWWCVVLCLCLGLRFAASDDTEPSQGGSGPDKHDKGDAGILLRNQTSNVPPVPRDMLHMYNPMTTNLMYDDSTCSLLVAYTAVPSKVAHCAVEAADGHTHYRRSDYARLFSFPLCSDWQPHGNVTNRVSTHPSTVPEFPTADLLPRSNPCRPGPPCPRPRSKHQWHLA